MATFPEPHLITAEQFLQIDFSPDIKAECVRVLLRTGANSWTDCLLGPEEMITVPPFNIAVPTADIFAR